MAPVVLAFAASGCAFVERTSMVAGGEPDGASTEAAVSADGRFVAFTSTAANLVAGDGNGLADVFLRDRITGSVSRVSNGTGGTEAHGPSSRPAISADGRYVAFQSDAADLVSGDTNGVTDVFVRDTVAGTTRRVSLPDGVTPATSVPSAGPAAPVAGTPAPAPAVSGDGMRVIVMLQTPFTPEGSLRASAAGSQRAAIARAQDVVTRAVAGTSTRVLHRLRSIPALVAVTDAAGLATLRGSPAVAEVIPDALAQPALATSAPLVGATAANVSGVDGTGQTIAVLDTGVDSTHPFLAPRVVEEACYSGNGNCPNGLTSQTGAGAGAPCTYAASACRHGSHVAGIAAGDSASFDGVAPAASLMSVQVFSRFTGALCSGMGENPCALSYTSDQILGLERVYELRSTRSFAAVNMSLGGSPSTTTCDGNPLKPVIDNLRSVGIATVVASGNDGTSDAISSPACISSAVSVGSTTKADAVSSFSNSAGFLSLLAPGSSITSSVPGGGFASFTGTSMATPHVAGAWALMKQQSPSAGVDTVLAALQATGEPVLDARNGLTKARVCVVAALALGSCPSAPPPNDDFANATPLIGASGSTLGSNIGATKQSGEPAHADGDGGASIWFSIVAPASGTLAVDTLGSTFDTLLGVYTGNEPSGLTQVAANDDQDPPTVLASSVGPFAVSEGTTYRIAVDGTAAATGAVRLQHQLTGTAQPRTTPSISADGRYVAFESADAGLVAGDTNGVSDVFVRDTATGATKRASVKSGGAGVTGASTHASISADGTRIAFDSVATDLVANDTNGVSDVFVRDLSGLTTRRVSVKPGGGQAGGASSEATLSANGLVVAFTSSAPDLVAGDGNGVPDVFVRDLGVPTTARVSISSSGDEASAASRSPSISEDGALVAFESDAADLAPDGNGATDVYVRHRAAGLTQRASTSFWLAEGNGASTAPSLSADGRHVGFTSTADNLDADPDTNLAADVYTRFSISPVVTGFAPSTLARGSSGVPFTVSGAGFLPGAFVSAGDGVVLTVATVTPTQITGTVSIAPDAVTGPVAIEITNLGGPGFARGVCPGCLDIT